MTTSITRRDIVPYKRTRAQGATASYNLSYSGGPLPGSSVAYSGVVALSTKEGMIKTMSDYVTPGFRSLSRLGKRFNNSMLSESKTYQPYLASGYYRVVWSGGWETLSGPTVSWIAGDCESQALQSISDADADAVKRTATINTWKNVAPSPLLPLVTAIERHETWNMIRDRAKKIAQIAIAVRKGDLKSLKKLLPRTKPAFLPRSIMLWDDDGRPLMSRRGKLRHYRQAFTMVDVNSLGSRLDQASKLWLEYRLGWTPLVYDIIGGLKAVYAADLRGELTPVDIHTARGKCSREWHSSTAAQNAAGGLTYVVKRDSKTSYNVRGYVHYRWSAPDGLLRRLNDFGLFEIPLSMWELVPFSFLIDRIVPVGDWLAGFTPKIGVEVLDVGHVIHHSVTYEQTIVGMVTPGYTAACPLGSKDRYTYEGVQRDLSLAYPSFPQIDAHMSIKQLTDVAALLRVLR